MTHATRRGIGTFVLIAVIALGLPLAGVATATDRGTLDVEPELQDRNVGDTVTLTATLSAAAPAQTNIDFENEDGANDGDGDTPQNPDRNCNIAIGAISCSVTYVVTTSGTDTWRAWIDHDGQNLTTEADSSEGRNEQTNPGSTNALTGACVNSGASEPDCTDVVEVNVGYLEVIPEQQTLDAGTTATLTARLFAPASQADGVNVDFENENGANDPDRGDTPTTPDRTCTIPQGQTDCSVTYQGSGGSDNWRAWVDTDKVQSTTEQDGLEGRDAGPTDCDQYPDDQEGTCGGPTANPGVGCDPDVPDVSEPDCTDLVQVTYRAGTVAQLDCDDQAGKAPGQDTERETNVDRSAQGNSQTDPSTEEYRCQLTDQLGNGINGQVVKAEVKNGVNDPDPTDGESYGDPDYQCTTRADEDVTLGIGAEQGVCYISVLQDERELGTAEICFWHGSGTEGQSLCADEPTGEAQQAGLADPGNDLADSVEKTWEDQSVLRLDCEPETASGPTGQAHTVRCVATSPSGATVSGVQVRGEFSGAGDPPADNGDTPFQPDASCVTGSDGSCSYSHTSSAVGTTTYRSWIDDRKAETAPPPRGDTDVDDTEGRDETVTPGRTGEPDNTDVTQKTWTAAPANVTMSPDADTAPVGECNPFTITVTDSSGNPVANAILDVEQVHERASNSTANDEPNVGFCEPPASGGPNPSDVDESKGDGGSTNQENPDNLGTAGGELTAATDANGRVTIGIEIAPANGSNGSGGVSVTAWWESSDNDDPDASEPKDSSVKTWTAAAGPPGVPAGVSLVPSSSSNEPGEQVTYTATVNDANGDPVEDATVSWTEDGAGEFLSQEAQTDASGRAQAVVTSSEEGTQTITATATECADGFSCSDSATQQWQQETCPGRESDSRNHVVGTPGDDVLTGTSGSDVICGLGGNDTIRGGGGNDLILSGGGNDTANGQGGSDTVKGQGGNDKLLGKKGSDNLVGGAGNDDLYGGAGRDRLKGGKGRDLLDGGGSKDSCNGGPGKDKLVRCE